MKRKREEEAGEEGDRKRRKIYKFEKYRISEIKEEEVKNKGDLHTMNEN